MGRSLPGDDYVSESVRSKVRKIAEVLELLWPDCNDAQHRRDFFTHIWGVIGHYQTTRRIQDSRTATTLSVFLGKRDEIQKTAGKLEGLLIELRHSGDSDFIADALQRDILGPGQWILWHQAIEMASSRIPPDDAKDEWGEYRIEDDLRRLQNHYRQAAIATRRDLPNKRNLGAKSILTRYGTPKQIYIRSLLDLFGESAWRADVYDEAS